MPELPEVETIRQDVLPFVKERVITKVEIVDPRSLKGISSSQFQKTLLGEKIVGVERKAKYLLFKLTSGRYLVIHLGMTGRLLFSPDDYVKVIFHLSGNRILYFSDARLFGKIKVFNGYPNLNLGPEPLSDDFDEEKFKQMLSKRKAAIKMVLLDQKFISGIGNIYAQEALFRAGIHPKRPAGSLSDFEIRKLHRKIKEVLKEALGYRGTSDSWYVDARGRKGSFQFKLRVYGRGGEPCLKCGATIKRLVMGNRGTYYCPRCQK
ncbi:MAG: bifunctional DNA-formamidopyrimidine glycosylase/DNA-(apurinic or apyrimidinic site) lyase [Candidatus Margulisiibacteriota bacterium]